MNSVSDTIKGTCENLAVLNHSRFLFYCAHGLMLFGNRIQALEYAMRQIGDSPAKRPTVNPQMWLDLEAAIKRARKTVPFSNLSESKIRGGKIQICLRS
jgi:hypothetical protein